MGSYTNSGVKTAGSEATPFRVEASRQEFQTADSVYATSLESARIRPTIPHAGTLGAGNSSSRNESPEQQTEPHLDDLAVSTIEEQLRPVARKQNIRALTKDPETDRTPVVCRIDAIRLAYVASGYNKEQIARITGLSVPTVRKALLAESSTKLYDFVAVLKVIGLDIADVIPARPRSGSREEYPPVWAAGPYARENAEAQLRESALGGRKPGREKKRVLR